MLSTLFANPALLWTLLALPACASVLLFARLRRKQALHQLANVLPLRRSVLLRPHIRFWITLCVLFGLCLTAIAAAGPQLGIDKSANVRKGRDVFIVFDLSRSMLAEQPNRRTLAARSLDDLANQFEHHGGHRVALIGFASKARLFFPLTEDCDHLRHVLKQIDAGDFASLSHEEPTSGTRIGAALTLAVSQCEPGRVHRPVIVLLSDGDDPTNDNEWLEGVQNAKANRIRIHTVGIGNPHAAETILIGREVLHFDGKPILTKLNEERLREIARETDGQYLPAHGNSIQLGVYLQYLLDADDPREEVPTDSALPIYQFRYAWFLLPAVILFMLAMFPNEGPAQRKEPTAMPSKSRKVPSISKSGALGLIVLAVLGISAADPPSSESLLRRGNEAFAAEQYEAALKHYEAVELMTLDPGLVSFNKAATYYRLGRYREAIDCYRRAVGDDAAPVERKARAYFDLANALVLHADDRAGPLAEAVAAYRACLQQPELPAKLRDDARYNLEIAQLRWLKARPNETPPETTPEGPSKKGPLEEKDPKSSDKTHYKPVDPDKTQKKAVDPNAPKGGQSKKLQAEGLTVLPDDDNVQALSKENTLDTLDQHARRIAEERRRLRNPAGPATLSTKDW